MIGTTSWHRTCGVEEQKSVDKFFGTLVNDLKNTKLRFIYHPVDLTTNDDKKEGFGDGKKDEGGRPRTTSLVEKVAELYEEFDRKFDRMINGKHDGNLSVKIQIWDQNQVKCTKK